MNSLQLVIGTDFLVANLVGNMGTLADCERLGSSKPAERYRHRDESDVTEFATLGMERQGRVAV